MDDKILAGTALSKILGGMSGNLIAQSILKPKSARDFISRSLSSILLAYFTTTSVMRWFDLRQDLETTMAVSLGVGCFGYFIVSVVLTTIATAKNVKELKENIK